MPNLPLAVMVVSGVVGLFIGNLLRLSTLVDLGVASSDRKSIFDFDFSRRMKRLHRERFPNSRKRFWSGVLIFGGVLVLVSSFFLALHRD